MRPSPLGDIHVPDTGNDVRRVPGSGTAEGARAIEHAMRSIRDRVRRRALRRRPARPARSRVR